MISEEQEWAEAFLDQEVEIRQQRRVATPSGGTTNEVQRLRHVPASVRPGSSSESQEGGRTVVVQLGEVRLGLHMQVHQGDTIEHEGDTWEVIGRGEHPSGAMLQVISVKRLVP